MSTIWYGKITKIWIPLYWDDIDKYDIQFSIQSLPAMHDGWVVFSIFLLTQNNEWLLMPYASSIHDSSKYFCLVFQLFNMNLREWLCFNDSNLHFLLSILSLKRHSQLGESIKLFKLILHQARF